MLKEEQIVRLSDNEKYIIVLKRKVINDVYYYAFKATGENKNFVILKEKGQELVVCEEDSIIKFFENELIKIAKK